MSSSSGKIVINRLKKLSTVNLMNNSTYLEDAIVEILLARGISDATNIVYYRKEDIPSQVSDYLNGDAIVFLEESTLSDSDGTESDRHLCIVPGDSFVSVFSSFIGSLHSFLEFKIYKKYFNISEKDPSLMFIPFLLFCLEVYKDVDQKKVSEIAVYLRKLKTVGKEKGFDWIRIASVFCGVIAYYAFDVDVEELGNSSYENDIRSVVVEDGELWDLFSLVDTYVDNPTKECSDKRKSNMKNEGFITDEDDSNLPLTSSDEEGLSGIRLVFQDFLDVLLFLKQNS